MELFEKSVGSILEHAAEDKDSTCAKNAPVQNEGELNESATSEESSVVQRMDCEFISDPSASGGRLSGNG